MIIKVGGGLAPLGPIGVYAYELCRERRGVVVSGVCRMDKVNERRARLVLGRGTVFGRLYTG